MSTFLIELWSTEKSYTALFKESTFCSLFMKSFDTFSKQKLYQLVLLFLLNFQISVLCMYI